MKERVLQGLHALSLSPDSADYAVQHDSYLASTLMEATGLDELSLRLRAETVLEYMLHNYTELGICTIDKFVHRIIRSFARDLQIAPDFEVELEQEDLLSKAIDLLISKVGDNDTLTRTLVEFTEEKANQDKSWHIEHDLLSFAKNILREDSEPFLAELKKTPIEEFFVIRERLTEKVEQFERDAATLGEEGIKVMEQHGVEASMFYQKARGLPGFFQNLAQLKRFEPSNYAIATVEEGKWSGSKPDAAAVRAMEAVKAPLTELFQRTVAFLDDDLKNYQLHKLLHEHLYAASVLNELDKVIAELKDNNNILLISDFNRYISEIVTNEPAPFIYERVGERYQNYLIDEFQDTSVMQWQNLLPLVENSLATANFNLIVGDGKQAIYRWRGGEVEQFGRLPKIHKNDDGQDDLERVLQYNYEERVLDTNYRSTEEVIEFNNDFFRKLADQELTEDYAAIYKSLEQKCPPGKSGGYVNVKVLEDTDDVAEVYLERIKETIEEGQRDNFRYRDMAILVNKNATGSEIAQYLISENIPVVSSESLLVNKSPEVRFIVDIFRHARDPRDNAPKAAIIRYLSQHVETDKTFNELVFEFSLNTEDKAKTPIIILDDFLKNFGFDMRLSKLVQQPIYQSAEDIIRVFALNKRSHAYLQFFLDAVHTYSSRFGNNTVEFLEWWELKQHTFSVKIPEGSDAVRIMTIHKAKGLQFPLVIVPFADWRLKDTNDHLWLPLQDEVEDLPVGLVRNKKELGVTEYESIYREERNKTMLDHINVLYVAFTRPKERLYVLTKMRQRRASKTYACDLIVNIVENMPDWNEGMGELPLGIPIDHEIELEDDDSQYKLDQLASNPWSDKLKISLQAPTVWDFEQVGEAQKYGALALQALSQLDNAEQLEQVCQSMFNEGLLNAEEHEGLRDQLQSILSISQVSQWFEKGQKVRVNPEILAQDGEIFQPHRIVISDEHTSVIEFKTGLAKNSDEKHMKTLLPLVAELGFDDVRGYLVYLADGSVVGV